MKPATAGALAALALVSASPATADVLIDNVQGMSLDENGRLDSFTGVLVGDDGRIEQVLKRGDKRPGKVDYRMDGKGRVLLPGLIDSHLPLMRFGLALLTQSANPPASQPRPEDRDMALLEAQQALFAQGITTVADMGTTIEDWQAYRRAGDAGRLKLRIVAFAEGVDAMILIGGPGPTPWLYEDRLRQNGVRLKLDGPLAAREAALKAPYADGPAKGAVARLSETQLKNLMSRAAMDGFQVAAEAHGDKSVADVLDAIAELGETYKRDLRWRIEGVDAIDQADLPRLGRFKVMVTMRADLSLAGQKAAEAALGPARLAGAHAWKSTSTGGATLAFGSTALSVAPRPFAAMASALTRADENGQPFSGWQPQEAISREAALGGWTVRGAQALFGEGRFGRIARGMRGDFVLVDRDPLLATPEDLRNTRVLQTWAGGKLVYQASEGAPVQDRQAEGR